MDLGDMAGSWSEWLQSVGKEVITTKVQSDYNPQLEMQRMQLKAQAQSGVGYTEGVANAVQSGSIAGIPTAWLILGALGFGVLAFVMND